MSTIANFDTSTSGSTVRDDTDDASSETTLLLSAALSLHIASERLTELDADGRAVARLAAEALRRGDVSPAALALVANVEGRSGILELLRGSAQLRDG
jgi:hypothetical protein